MNSIGCVQHDCDECKRREALAVSKPNTDNTVAVSTTVYWLPIDANTPRGQKLQLLGKGGVAVYGIYNGDAFWTHWQALPRRREDQRYNIVDDEDLDRFGCAPEPTD
jgi:hypothetical protein